MTDRQISFTAVGIAIVSFLLNVGGRVFPDFLTRKHGGIYVSIDQVDGLRAELDGKAAADHNHNGVYEPARHYQVEEEEEEEVGEVEEQHN